MSDNNEEIKRIIINLDGAKCSGCDEYLGENEMGERCEKCEKDLDDDEEEEDYCWKHEVAILPCEDCENGVKCDDWEEGDCVDDQDDVPWFPAKDNVPDIPPHKFIARDVDGVMWQYDAEDDEWTRVEDENKIECSRCDKECWASDLNHHSLSVSVCDECNGSVVLKCKCEMCKCARGE